MKTGSWIILMLLGITLGLEITSCKHSPVLSDDDFMPIDTSDNPGDTITVPGDTISGTPCDPETIYFDKDILPILRSNCAFSGCHDASSAQDGVILESYESVLQTADIEPYDLDHSEIYEVLTEDDPDKRMPPSPASPLSAAQVNLIAKWILQGAEKKECDPDAGVCNTENVSFSGFVKPVIQNHCQGCHSGSAPSGGIDLSTHSNVNTQALSGKLYGAISWQSGFKQMPQGGNQLPDCTIDKIKSWIDAGAQNN